MLFHPVEDSEAEQAEYVDMILEERKEAFRGTTHLFGLLHGLLALRQLRQEVNEHIGNRDPTCGRKPAAARDAVEESEPTAEDVNRRKNQSGDQRRGDVLAHEHRPFLASEG